MRVEWMCVVVLLLANVSYGGQAEAQQARSQCETELELAKSARDAAFQLKLDAEEYIDMMLPCHPEYEFKLGLFMQIVEGYNRCQDAIDKANSDDDAEGEQSAGTVHFNNQEWDDAEDDYQDSAAFSEYAQYEAEQVDQNFTILTSD